jgi:hypothetical protein
LFVIVVLCHCSKIPPPGSSWCELGSKYPAQTRMSEQLHNLFTCDIDWPGSAVCSFSFSVFVLLFVIVIVVVVFVFIFFVLSVIVFVYAIIVGQFEGDLNPTQVARGIYSSISLKDEG